MILLYPLATGYGLFPLEHNFLGEAALASRGKSPRGGADDSPGQPALPMVREGPICLTKRPAVGLHSATVNRNLE